MKQYNFIKDSDASGEESVVIAQKKKRKLDLFTRIVCLIFAFFMWIYFVNVNDDNVTAEIKVKLDIVGQETLKESGQMVYGLDTQEITIVVKGTNRDIKRFSSSDYKVTVDVSSIKGSGKHILDVHTSLPGDSSSKLSIESITPQNVIIYSDEIYTADVPLEVVNVGVTAADPYIIGDITKSAETVQITGPRAIIESISKGGKAQFRVSESEPLLESRTYTDFKLDFCDANGEFVPYDDTIITYSTSNITVTVPVYAQKDVGFSILSGGAPIDSTKYTVVVSPDTVAVLGSPTFMHSSSMKNYKIAIDLTADEFDAGSAIRFITDSELLAGLVLDKREESVTDNAVKITITVTEK